VAKSLFPLQTTATVQRIGGIKSPSTLEQRHLRRQVIGLNHLDGTMIVSEADVLRTSICTCAT
jgi:hypothetical protein